ncbi:MAG: hypothetical protein ACXWLM_06090 [Myxococcales bacterium]
MRALAAAALAAALWSCSSHDGVHRIADPEDADAGEPVASGGRGPVDAGTGTPPSTASGGPAAAPDGGAAAPDGGAAVDAGIFPDAGAASDAGAPDSGVDPCHGLAPSTEGMRSWSVAADAGVTAAGGTTDGDGLLGLLSEGPRNHALHMLHPDGTWVGTITIQNMVGLAPLTQGFTTIVYPGDDPDAYGVFELAPGRYLLRFVVYGLPAWAMPALGTQYLIAGPFHDGPSSAPSPQARWIDVSGSGLQSSGPLASAAAIVAAGADGSGSSLVVFAGATPGTLDAQWFGPRAQASTGLFPLLNDAPGWLTVSPALGGGVLIRGYDLPARTGHLCLLATDATACTPPPAWMLSRPGADLHVARGGRAWASLTRAANCADSVEIIAPDGTSCGSAELSQGACDRPRPEVGVDGTVVQATTGPPAAWSWWPAMLR